MKEMEITMNGYQVIEKEVGDAKTSGRLFVPKEWIGKRVKVVLIEPLEEEDGKKEGVVLTNKDNISN